MRRRFLICTIIMLIGAFLIIKNFDKDNLLLKNDFIIDVDNQMAVYINTDNGYEKRDTIPDSGYVLNEEESYCTVDKEKDTSISITYDTTSKTLAISPMTTKGTKCYLYFDTPTNIEELLATKTIDIRDDFTQPLESDTTGIVYETKDNDGTTYYYAGAPTDNWVKFGKWSEDTPDVYFGTNYDANSIDYAKEFLTKEECDQVYNNCRLISRAGKDMYWRIIRINGNGSLRLIYAGTTPVHLNDDPFIGVSAFNNNVDDNAYVGYMYGIPGSSTYEETHNNINDSVIKTIVDEWYEKNILPYNSKIDTESGFCADRRISSVNSSLPQAGIGKTTNYYYSIDITEKLPSEILSLKCANVNDYFTMSTSNVGNKSLTYPVALINILEAIYAGYATKDENYEWHYVMNQNMYLYTKYIFRTMTPGMFTESRATIFHINSRANGEGYFSTGTSPMYETIRPVINLKSDITFTSGDGTSSNPYVIST